MRIQERVYVNVLASAIVIPIIMCILSLSKLSLEEAHSVALSTLRIILIWCLIAIANRFVATPLRKTRFVGRLLENPPEFAWPQMLVFFIFLPLVLFSATAVAKFLHLGPYCGPLLYGTFAMVAAILISRFCRKSEDRGSDRNQ